jgi:copper chaperone CopZ
VTRAAKNVEGVKTCKADRKARTAEVTYAPSKTTPEAIAKVISDETGFKTTAPKKR